MRIPLLTGVFIDAVIVKKVIYFSLEKSENSILLYIKMCGKKRIFLCSCIPLNEHLLKALGDCKLLRRAYDNSFLMKDLMRRFDKQRSFKRNISNKTFFKSVHISF